MGYLITDGDHGSEQSDRVLCIDGRSRGSRALLTELLLFLAKCHRPPTPPPFLTLLPPARLSSSFFPSAPS